MNLRKSRLARVGVLVASGCCAAGLGLVAAPVADAAPVSLSLNYSCNFPLLLPQRLAITITSDIPTTQPVGVKTDAFVITANATVDATAAAGLRAIDAVSVEGTALALSTVVKPEGTSIPIKVPTTITKTAIPTSGPLVTAATGETPPIQFSQPGVAGIDVNDIVLTLTPRLADGTLSGLDTFESECTQLPGQAHRLATINIVPNGTTPPVTTPPVTTPPKTTPVVTTPPVTTPTSNFSVGGTAVLKTLVKGNLPITGTFKATPGTLNGDLALNQSSASLTALGFLPVKATMLLVPTAPLAGTVSNGSATANLKVRVKLPAISVAGIPLGGGTNCQASQISSIPLTSTGTYSATTGGSLAGTFSISNLTGCGGLTGLVSPLTAGGGNALALKFTPST